MRPLVVLVAAGLIVSGCTSEELAIAAGKPQKKFADYLARHALDPDDCRCP